MDTITILVTALVTLAVCAALSYMNKEYLNMRNEMKSKDIDVSLVKDEPLRKIIQKLSDRIDNMSREDKKIGDKISALQQSDGVSREQTKYLTATVNKANFGS